MKRAIIISCFDWYKGRLEYIEQSLISKGYDVKVWTSDFSHFDKCRIVKAENINYIHVPSYKKNLSLARMFSHYIFAKKIAKILNVVKPDLVYAVIPPNFVASVCGVYKRNHTDSKLIFDVIDMWPESYTANRLIELPFRLWANLRDNSLQYADHIFTECELYQRFLDSRLCDKMSSLRLCRESACFAPLPMWNQKSLDICYLGSINQLIDIQLIGSLVKELVGRFKVNVHIVGGGATKGELVASLEKVGANVKDHGVIFEKEKMRLIIGSSHFALNMMKPSVCVGLTIKSMDYFQLGVPILNTIKGDTHNFVDSYHCGFNIDNITDVVCKISNLSSLDYANMRINTQNVFIEKLGRDAFVKSLNDGFKTFL